MSLTERGLQERKWGEFPALRRALADRPLSPDHDGWTPTADTTLTGVQLLLETCGSTADTLPERLGRLLEIAALARDRGDKICETTRETGWEAMHRDLERLSGELRELSDYLRHIADEVRRLHELDNQG